MTRFQQSPLYIPPGVGLRNELSLRSAHLATTFGHLHERTDGNVPSILFGRDEQGRHGNFHPASYAAICAEPTWAKRLEKIHSASKRMKPRSNWQWKELDCSNSSDALLMNIFCHPQTVLETRLRTLLNVGHNAQPEFGFKPRTPLLNGKSDNTEVDMKIGDLLIEAKLTESDFQSASPNLILRYRDLEAVFDVSELPLHNGKHAGYQLIRGASAAYSWNIRSVFCAMIADPTSSKSGTRFCARWVRRGCAAGSNCLRDRNSPQLFRATCKIFSLSNTESIDVQRAGGGESLLESAA